MSRRATIIDDSSTGAPDVAIDIAPIDPIEPISDDGTVETINGFETANPADSISGSGGSGGARKRRGRPPGSTNTAKASRKTDLTGMEEILLSLHFMGAAICDCPELQLEEKEAKNLSTAINRVTAFYDHTINPKTLAWVNLLMVAGGIYGGRAFAIRARLKEEERRAAGSIPATATAPGPRVVHMDRPAPAPAPPPAASGGRAQTPADMFGPLYGGGNMGPEFEQTAG